MSETSPEVATPPESSGDGRRARRDRNRDAVVDALLGLFCDGNLAPTVAEVAARSEVSHRSVFRYFEDIDELGRAAVERQQSRVGHLMQIPDIGEGSLPERIDAIVGQRMALYEEVKATARVARLRAPFQPVIAASLAASRALLYDQVRIHFDAELSAMDEADADDTAAAVDVLLSFESCELLRESHQRSVDATASVLR
ncbi:MAG: TetR/AcrR family transcriptional regulator, partial [Acidimicrobiales bacterium]